MVRPLQAVEINRSTCRNTVVIIELYIYNMLYTRRYIKYRNNTKNKISNVKVLHYYYYVFTSVLLYDTRDFLKGKH